MTSSSVVTLNFTPRNKQKNKVRLTPTEEIVNLKILEGKSNQEIADDLAVSINTVKTHVARILKKEKVKNRIQLISNQFNKK